MTGQRHIARALDDLSIKCLQDEKVYQWASGLAPVKKVAKESDKYYTYSNDQQFRSHETVRADRTQAKEIYYTDLSTSSYQLIEHSAKELVTDRMRGNADPAVNPEMDAVQELGDVLQREKSLKVAEIFFTSTSFSTNSLSLTAGTGQYDVNTTTSVPIDDADVAREAILKTTGQIANGVVMGEPTKNILARHGDIIDRVKWSERGIITEDILATLLGVEKVDVVKVIYRSTNEGISVTTDWVINKSLLYYYNNPKPGIKSCNLGIAFTGLLGDTTPKVKRYRDESLAGDWVEMSWMYDIKIVQSLSGYLISDAHS